MEKRFKMTISGDTKDKHMEESPQMCQKFGLMLKMAISDHIKDRCMEERPQMCQKCG